MTKSILIPGGNVDASQFRCAVCVSNGLPGERFYLETVGSGVKSLRGKLTISELGDVTAIYCAKCKDDGVKGWRGVAGLIAEGPDFSIHKVFV